MAPDPKSKKVWSRAADGRLHAIEECRVTLCRVTKTRITSPADSSPGGSNSIGDAGTSAVNFVTSANATSSKTLYTLPPEVRDKIASYLLSYEDRVSLATTHPNFGYMMPWEQIVEGTELNG